jgi:hypothetical protein
MFRIWYAAMHLAKLEDALYLGNPEMMAAAIGVMFYRAHEAFPVSPSTF